MKYTRQDHSNFLEEELQAQTRAFKQKLDTSATSLLMKKDELFVAQFLTIKDGEMILKFSSERGLPRKGEYLYCFTVTKELRNYRKWGNRTYGDLIKEKSNFTEAVCVWQAPAKDKEGNIEKDFFIAGFKGIDLEFAVNISKAEKMILLLGPIKPPYEYLANLKQIVLNNVSENVNFVLDQDFQPSIKQPILIDNKSDISEFILNQLQLNDQVILIGPPGTGKTYQIAEICKKLCKQNKSVLVTSLTNRALIEVIEKPALVGLLDSHKIFKTKISTDEAKEFPLLQSMNIINPQRGSIVLSTFFTTSGEATKFDNVPPFDYVIVDEASQALLAMFGISKLLGKKNIWIGDAKQLPPIVSLNEDKVYKKKYGFLVNGLKTISEIGTVPLYQMTESYRLTKRGADYTGIFYNNSLKSKVENLLPIFKTQAEISDYFNPNGGPTLIKTELKVGDKKPENAIELAEKIVANLLQSSSKLHISVLSNYIATVKALQKRIYQSVGNPKNLLIETVARIQGLTTDVTIFVIPNTGYNHSLRRSLFNVATSRSRQHTIIISDKNILENYANIDEEVQSYLYNLNSDFSFCHNIESKALLMSNNLKDDEPTQSKSQLTSSANKNIAVKVVGKIDLSKFKKPKKEIKINKVNIYIIDTNVFVDYPEIIAKISVDYPVILSAKVLDELDNLKSTLDKDGSIKVQKALKSINRNMDTRDIKMEMADLSLLPIDFNKRSPDNMILTVALKYILENPILLTSDNGLQIKAKGLGISTITLKEFLRR